jgi:class 3 adenylate cyclase
VATDVSYARNGELELAYATYGPADADRRIVLVPGLLAHLDFNEEIPYYRPFIDRLRGLGRLVVFDKRGCGLSSRSRLGSPEEQVDDVVAVMDAAGVERATIVGTADGGPIGILVAASRPHRVSALVLHATGPRFTATEDYPHGRDPTYLEAAAEHMRAATLGPQPTLVYDGAPPSAGSLLQHWYRNIATPSGWWEMQMQQGRFDVRAALSLVSCPTLVIHNRGDTYFPPAGGRFLAEHISGAEFVELDIDGHCSWDGSSIEAACDEIERFLAGDEHGAVAAERLLATVVFVDIVASTSHATTVGDRRWRALLSTFDAATADAAVRHGGRVVKSTGDGCLMLFDGPAKGVRAAVDLTKTGERLGVAVRGGVHTGEVELRGDDIGGVAVHLAARIEAEADPGEVFVSQTVGDLTLGSTLHFAEAGRRRLKGFGEREWSLLRVVPA